MCSIVNPQIKKPSNAYIKRDTHAAARNAEASKEALTPAGAH